jgi:hypothetical protein
MLPKASEACNFNKKINNKNGNNNNSAGIAGRSATGGTAMLLGQQFSPFSDPRQTT